MAQIHDFQKIAEEYANQIAKERNTKVVWVCLDGNRPELKNHRTQKLSYKVGKPRLDWDEPSLKPDIMYDHVLENDSPETITTVVERSEKKTDTYKNSITTGISLGYAVEANFGVDFAGGKVTQNIKFNFSYSHAWEYEVERSWSVSQTIPQVPHSTTKVQWILEREAAKCSFRAEIDITGSVAIWFRDRIEWRNGTDKHHLWFQNPGVIVKALQPDGFRDDGFRANLRATGIIEAEVGLRSRLRVTARPLQSNEAAASMSAVEYLLNQDGKVLRE